MQHTSDSTVKLMNQWLGDSLGKLANGKPRFCWMWAPDMPYWGRRLGAVWVMTTWKRPTMTPKQWALEFDIPYPADGMWHAICETQLNPGSKPTFHLTQNYIKAIDWQMSQFGVQDGTPVDELVEQNVKDTETEVMQHREDQDLAFRQGFQDDSPAFNNFAPGKRGNHVSFGGTV